MLTSLEVGLFKCFERLVLPLRELTVFSGANGSGKSSALQAIALLSQTMRDHEWSTRLILNGRDLRLGSVGDVVDKLHGRRNFWIGIDCDVGAYVWRFGGERSELTAALEEVTVQGKQHAAPGIVRYLLPPGEGSDELVQCLRRATYLTAERTGPREVYELEDHGQPSVVGGMGQHAVSVLYSGRDERIEEGIVLHGTPPTLLRQVEGRMATFFPGCGLELTRVPNANAVTLGMRTSPATDFHRPTHVGFGLTQVLPIVIAGLSARPGDLVMIENPEVHLHPAGQAAMGEFLGELTRAGIQVLLETHSDHVLNGIRRSVRAGDVAADDVTIHFFQDDAEQRVVSPQIDANGAIDAWPDGFFDQFEKDTTYLAGWGGLDEPPAQ